MQSSLMKSCPPHLVTWLQDLDLSETVGAIKSIWLIVSKCTALFLLFPFDSAQISNYSHNNQ